MEKTNTTTFTFKASLMECLTNVIAATVIVGAFFVIRGYGLEKILEMVCFNVISGVIYMDSDDWTCKFFNKEFRSLINWQEYVGIGTVMASAILALCFVYSTSVAGWYCLAGCALLASVSFYWFKVVYLKSIVGTEGLDLYDRKKISKRLERALAKGEKNVVFRLLAKTLRYDCSDKDYEKGSDYSMPFDSDHRRTYLQLNRSKTQADKTTAKNVYNILLALVHKMFENHQVVVEWTSEELDAIADVEKGE